MKQVTINSSLHGYPQFAKLWVYPCHGKYVLIEDIKAKNQRIVNPQNVLQ